MCPFTGWESQPCFLCYSPHLQLPIDKVMVLLPIMVRVVTWQLMDGRLGRWVPSLTWNWLRVGRWALPLAWNCLRAKTSPCQQSLCEGRPGRGTVQSLCLYHIVMCRLRPGARSQAKLGQAKPGPTFGLRWALAWPGVLEGQSQAKASGLGPGFCTHEI